LKFFLKAIASLFDNFTFAAKSLTYLELKAYSVGKAFSFLDLALIIFYFIITLSYSKTINKYPESICFFNLFILYFFAVCMSSAMIIFRQRISLLFIPACWFVFVWLIMAEKKRIKLTLFAILVFYGVFLIYRLTSNDILYQYDNYLLSEKVIPRKERVEIYHKEKLRLKEQ
jgi:hypothetical protein